MRKDKAESVDVSGWATSLQGPIGPASVLDGEGLSFPQPINQFNLMELIQLNL